MVLLRTLFVPPSKNSSTWAMDSMLSHSSISWSAQWSTASENELSKNEPESFRPTPHSVWPSILPTMKSS